MYMYIRTYTRLTFIITIPHLLFTHAFEDEVSCDSLVLQGLRCEWGSGVLNLVLSLSLSHTGHWKFNMAPYGKELSEDLLLYIKMA